MNRLRASFATALFCAALARCFGADTAPLTAEAPIEREMRGGETHLFRIGAAAGQMIHARVEQQGIDVSVRLLSPDGRELALSDCPNSAWGPEVVAVIAETAGDYVLKVASGDPAAGAGKYVARLVALRDATPADRERAAAEAAYVRAEQFRRQRTAASRKAALGEYEKALPFFDRAGEPYRQGMILNSSGLIYAQLGDFASALPRYQRAMELFGEAGDARGGANAANNAGGVYDVLGDFPKALDSFERALTLYRSAGAAADEANTLSNIGKIYSDQSNWQKAIERFRQALPIVEAARDARREAAVLGNLGACYRLMGEYPMALDYLSRALARWKASDDPARQAITLETIGAVFQAQRHFPEALSHFEQALVFYTQSGDRRGQGLARMRIGDLEAQLGDRVKALDALGQASELLRGAADRRSEALALLATARVYADAGQHGKTLECAGQALAAFRALGDRSNEADTLLAMAIAQRGLGNRAEARRIGEEALAATEQARAGAGAGDTRASYFASRQSAYAFMIDLLSELRLDAEALETSERARARSLLEMLAESRADVREGVDPKRLAREREVSALLNAKAARLAPLAGRDTPQAAALKQDIRALETEYQEIESAIRESSPRYAALTQPQPIKAEQIRTEVLDGDSALLEYSLGESGSHLWVLTKDGISAWALPAREKIEHQVERVSELLTARSATRHMESPAARQKRIEAADAELPAAARALSDSVLGPAAAKLAGKRLVIVPDGGLQRLPFAMLPTPGSSEPLAAAHEVIVLPSASALAVLRSENIGRKSAGKALAIFADPVFDASDPRAGRGGAADRAPAAPELTRILEHLAAPKDNGAPTVSIPRLPYTAQEADQILRVARDGSNWNASGFEATRAAVLGGELSRYRYIHFATHGFLDTEQPGLSALVLSQIDEDKRPIDGFLRVNDIYNIRLSADLVVLSACQTGLGREVRGEGLMGLTRAFLYAGAPRLVVSLWNVNDRATAELMAAFYRRVLRDRQTPAAALRAAQMEMRKQKRWESPYYWAAFVNYGEWR